MSSTDIHSHLIPGIDDGAVDIETSIQLIEELKNLGYTKLITTPHVSDIFPNTTKDILEGYRGLKSELLQRNITIELEVAAEYYADEYFGKLLESKDILSFGKENYLLFELSYFTPPHDIDNLIYEIQLKGYTPVLAHPERYLYWHYDFNRYYELKEMGVLFQINLNSISGYYNEGIQLIVEQLIKNSLVDFVGSDTHHMTHIKNLKK
ncbi:MAG: capsular biosynthesis protein, partial [Epsilonproteobacteria bacterium]|nr:capsular biosynthesis protein [Campylobacterota bacterium]